MRGLYSHSHEYRKIFWGNRFPRISQILEGIHFGAHTCRACIHTRANTEEKIPGELFMYWFRARGYYKWSCVTIAISINRRLHTPEPRNPQKVYKMSSRASPPGVSIKCQTGPRTLTLTPFWLFSGSFDTSSTLFWHSRPGGRGRFWGQRASGLLCMAVPTAKVVVQGKIAIPFFIVQKEWLSSGSGMSVKVVHHVQGTPWKLQWWASLSKRLWRESFKNIVMGSSWCFSLPIYRPTYQLSSVSSISCYWQRCYD